VGDVAVERAAARDKRELPLSAFYTVDDDGDFPEDELAETLFGVAQTPKTII